MKYINITNADIVNCMTDEQKHVLASQCVLNGLEPKETIELIRDATNKTINLGISICNCYFETSSGKKYLENLKKIEKLGE